MDWWQAIVLGFVQGLTEFLPVSSSGHLMIFKELVGADTEGFLDFTVTVHFATVLSTLIVFWSAIRKLIVGFFKFRDSDEMDYALKIFVSIIPVAIVGFVFKDVVEGLFGENLTTVAIALVITSLLLLLSDYAAKVFTFAREEKNHARNGISWWQAFVVGIAQALAVMPGLSRSGSTIATGLICGVRRDVMAQFSFLMVLIPIIGEQSLDILKSLTGHADAAAGGVSLLCLALGFAAAFASGLFACKAMVALVRKARLGWFSLYCLIVAALIFILA
ncbi:MAG: undecaprenyl-diphosphate phosphatase [Bacteroidales bacterium]|nr:undecaprenyl-diphosphate phosphatase [Bacteroidales bacterium]